MNLKKYGIALFVVCALAGGFAAGYLGNRLTGEKAEAEEQSLAAAPRSISTRPARHERKLSELEEADAYFQEMAAVYGSAYCVPFTQIFKKPAFALLFGAKPEIGRHQGKF